jgi:hypothetical protein
MAIIDLVKQRNDVLEFFFLKSRFDAVLRIPIQYIKVLLGPLLLVRIHRQLSWIEARKLCRWQYIQH